VTRGPMRKLPDAARDLARSAVTAGRRLRAPRVARIARGAVHGHGGDILVEVGVPFDRGARVLVVGSDPYDDRVTCLADLRAEGALPPRAFDLIALTDARPTRAFVAIDNADRALRHGGVLVCGATWPVGRALARRFDHVTKHGVGPWRVVEAWSEHDAGA